MEKQTPLIPEDERRLWFPNMPPRKGLAISTFFSLILLLVTIRIFLQQPCLGVVWAPTKDGRGLTIKSSTESGLLHPGTIIKSLQAPDGRSIMLENNMLIEDPDQFSTYAAYNAFFDQQCRLMMFYGQNALRLTDNNGNSLLLMLKSERALTQIPSSFWLLNVSAAICFLIGSGVWWYRRGDTTARLLAVTALCYFLSILCLSIYSSRELVLDPVLFRSLSAANHLFSLIWCYSLLLMFTYYPARLGNIKTTTLIILTVPIVWLNQTFQWYETPVHAYYSLNFIIPYLVAIVLGYRQWRQTTRQPVERAALRWFILTIWINIGLAGALFVIPGISQNYSAIPMWIPALSILLMFVCFAFGVLRHGLFDLEQWWFTGWVWLASGLLIAGIDMFLVYILDVGFQTLLPYSILLLGWVYFPLRQWLWRRLVKPKTHLLEHHLPALIQSLLESKTLQSFIDKWAELLNKIFDPLKQTVKEMPQAHVATLNHGLVLQVPGLDGRKVCHLIGNRQGTRLFSRRDAELAKALLDLSRAIFAITNRTREIQQKGAAEERERIMRDLHDDVLPKLITIKHKSPNMTISNIAEAAFQSIRETIYILRHPASKPLDECLADWRGEVAERLSPTAINLHWQTLRNVDGYLLTSVQFINCGRILREGVSNILQHADATQVRIHFEIKNGHIEMVINDNGRGTPQRSLKGVGTNNMRLRAKALNGHITWSNGKDGLEGNQDGLKVALSFPNTCHIKKEPILPALHSQTKE